MVTSTPVGDVFIQAFKEKFGPLLVFSESIPESAICPGTSMTEWQLEGRTVLNLSWHPSKVCNETHSAAWSAALVRIIGLPAKYLLHNPEYITAAIKVITGLASEFRAEHALLIQSVRSRPEDVKAALLADVKGAALHAKALMMILVSCSSALHAAYSSILSAAKDLTTLDSILRGSQGSNAVVPMVCKTEGNLSLTTIVATMLRKLEELGLDFQKMSASQLRWKAANLLVSMSAGEQGAACQTPP